MLLCVGVFHCLYYTLIVRKNQGFLQNFVLSERIFFFGICEIFVLRCTFVVSPAGRLCYTGRKGRGRHVAQV